MIPSITRSYRSSVVFPQESETLMAKFKASDNKELLVLHNKSPQWNEGMFCMFTLVFMHSF